MGSAAAGVFRRIARFSWSGHQSRLLPPPARWLWRPVEAERPRPPALSSFVSPATASGRSDTGLLSAAGNSDVQRAAHGRRVPPGNRHHLVPPVVHDQRQLAPEPALDLPDAAEVD